MACLWGVVSVEINGQELFSRSLFKQVFTARSLKKKKSSIASQLDFISEGGNHFCGILGFSIRQYPMEGFEERPCAVLLHKPARSHTERQTDYLRRESLFQMRKPKLSQKRRTMKRLQVQLWHMWLRWVKQQKMKEWSAQLSQKEVWRTQNVSNLWNDAHVHTPGLMLNWRLALNAQLLSPYMCLYMNDLDILGRNRPHLVSFGTFCVCVFF